MRTIYLDEKYICHSDNAEGRTAVQTDALDSVPDVALECYRFIPAHGEHVDFIQCIDSKTETMISRQVAVDEAKHLEEEAELIDEMEKLCEEIINE